MAMRTNRPFRIPSKSHRHAFVSYPSPTSRSLQALGPRPLSQKQKYRPTGRTATAFIPSSANRNIKAIQPRVRTKGTRVSSFASGRASQALKIDGTLQPKVTAILKRLPSKPENLPAGEGWDLGRLRGTYTGQVRQRIVNARNYPGIARRRGMEGQPVVAFTLNKQGQLTQLRLDRTSGYKLLDQAALDAVQKGAPYPEIPPQLKMRFFQFKLPVSFILK